jgi:hypothetical protein
MKVNEMTKKEAKDYIDLSFELFEERSNHDWELDITYLKNYIN